MIARINIKWWMIVPLLLVVASIASLGLSNADIPGNGEFYAFNTIGGYENRFTPTHTMQRVIRTGISHSPLYFMVLSVWAQLTDVSLVMLRTLSFFVGVLGVAFTYRLGCDIHSRKSGFFAAVMMSICAYFIYFMHDARIYGTLPLLACIISWSYWNIIGKDRRTWFFYGILYAASSAILYTHYYGIFLLIGIGFYHLFFVRKDRRWFQVVLVMLLVGFTFSFWLPIFIDNLHQTTEIFLEEDTANLRSFTILESLLAFVELYLNQIALFGLVYLIGIIDAVRYRTKPLIFSLCISVVPIIGMILLNEFIPTLYYSEMRYTLLIVPSLAVLFGYGIHILVTRQQKWIILIPILAIAAILFTRSDNFLAYTSQKAQITGYPTFHLIVDHVRDHQYMPDSEPLLTMTDVEVPRSVVRYYSQTFDNQYLHINPDDMLTSVGNVITDTLVDLINFETKPAFWLAYRPEFDLQSNDIYQNILTEYHDSCGVRESNDDMIIEYYLKKGVPCQLIDAEYMVQYEHDDITLTHFYHEIDGDTLRFFSIWKRASTRSAFPYSISFQIFDRTGEKVLQQDFISPFEPIDKKELDISGLDTGTYTLRVILYDAETRFINQGHLEPYAPQDNVTLTEFTISR